MSLYDVFKTYVIFCFREKDMNDFLFMLTATLKLPSIPSINFQDAEIDPNELTNSSNDSDKTIVNNGYSYSSPEEESNTRQHV